MSDDSEFATLRASEQRQAFLLKLSDALRPLGDPLDRQETAARLLGEHLDVNRVGYAELGTSHPTIRREYLRGVAPLAGRGLDGAFGLAFQDAFQRGETVVVSDVRTDPRFSESARAVLGEREIAALVGVTLLKGGQLVAAFGANNATPRDWTSGEVELIRDVAERTWEAVERARAEAALRGSEERLAFLLKLSDALRPLIDPNEMAAAASRLLGEHLRANRVVYADIEGDEFVIRHTFDSGVGRLSGRGPVSCMGAAFLDSYRRGEAIAVHDVRADASLTEPERAGLQRNSIAAFAMSGMLKNGQWVSSLGVHSATPRIWTSSELELIRDVADRTWEALERAHAEAALRLANQELRESEQRFLIIHDRAPFAISLTSVPDGRIVSVNDAFEQLFEFTREELLGKTRVELGISTPPLNAELVGELERNGALRDFEVRRWTKSGVERVLLLSIDPVKIAGRDYLLTTMVDVTDEKHAEKAELERRTAQLSQMASDLTLAEQHAREQLAKTLHDGLQQLLVSASMNLDRQVKREARRGAGTDALDEVKSHIDEAIAAARSLSFELFPPVLHGSGLPAALAWLADWTRSQYGLVVQVSTDPLANSDRKDVRTLLFESVRELLFNAVKHAQVDRVTLDLVIDADNAVCITVADEGVGFDPEKLVERARASQVGWGLFSIRERLTLLGGRLEIESAPGRGTRFRLIVPRREGRVVGAQTPPATLAFHDAPGFASAPALRILIVDDHAAVRRVFRELLQERPELHVVGEAANGIEAIAEAQAMRPDVILMDVSMPEMDGVEATRRLSAELPFIQILGLSTHLRGNGLHPIERAGAAGFFTKGVDTQRLIDHLIVRHAARSRSLL